MVSRRETRAMVLDDGRGVRRVRHVAARLDHTLRGGLPAPVGSAGRGLELGAARRVGCADRAGTGLAFVASGLATLLLHLWPGPFPAEAARAVYGGLALVPVFVAARG